MKRWMNNLALHYKKVRERHGNKNLLIAFDIDGTILDMRHMILYVLKSFDKELGTQYFRGLTFHDIDFHEDHVWTARTSIDAVVQRKQCSLSSRSASYQATAFPESQHPFHGVLDIIHWFQQQTNGLLWASIRGDRSHFGQIPLRP